MNDGVTIDSTESLPRGWEFEVSSVEEPWPDLPDGLREKILMAVGQASVCWEDESVFDAGRAIVVAQGLAWEIDAAYSEKEQV